MLTHLRIAAKIATHSTSQKLSSIGRNVRAALIVMFQNRKHKYYIAIFTSAKCTRLSAVFLSLVFVRIEFAMIQVKTVRV